MCIRDRVHTGAIFVDGLGVGDVGNIVLRDRQHLSEDGIMIVVMTLERHSNVVLAGPDIVSRGFVYVRESEDLMEHARQVVETALDSCLENNITDWGKIKTCLLYTSKQGTSLQRFPGITDISGKGSSLRTEGF